MLIGCVLALGGLSTATAFSLELTNGYTFTWSVDEGKGTLDGELVFDASVITDGGCWAGIGFRPHNVIDMSNADYIIGANVSSLPAVVTERKTDPTYPYKWPVATEGTAIVDPLRGQ